MVCFRLRGGRPRSFAFSDVVALSAVKESDSESSEYWKARLECRDGTRIRLGQEGVRRNERIRAYLEEIRSATGTAES
jgi:hypothetical protein